MIKNIDCPDCGVQVAYVEADPSKVDQKLYCTPCADKHPKKRKKSLNPLLEKVLSKEVLTTEENAELLSMIIRGY